MKQQEKREYSLVNIDAYDLDGNVVRSYTSIVYDTGKMYSIEESALNTDDKGKEKLEQLKVKYNIKDK